MNNFIIYSIEIAICLTLFYAVYWLFLRKETFFKLNRVYLIFSVVLAFLIPLLNITTDNILSENSVITKYLTLPIKRYEKTIDNNIGSKSLFEKNKMPFAQSSEIIESGLPTNSKLTSVQSSPDQIIHKQSIEEISSIKKVNWLSIGLLIYFSGVVLFLLRFLANFVWIFSLILKYKAKQISGLKVIKLEKNTSPFSFLNFIFIGNTEYSEEELAKIISHEKIHIKQKHTIDLILFELLMVFQWFNPAVWLYKRAVRINHEYLADLGTINSGVDLPSYQYSLLNQVLRANNFEIVSSYNFSVKKRISMMMKKRSPKLSIFKFTIALPVLLILFSAFAFNYNSSEKETKHNETNASVFTDSTIKKVDVPLEYLRMLEGEYVSTNDPVKQRRIVITELFGELLGYDNGYFYRLVPVGDGKFINPDDKATLEFDTKHKNAISLLLFGKINLNKLKGKQNRSLAFYTAKTISKSGIKEALSFYKSAKDSANYYFLENELNYAGYQMLQSGKAKESAALFKINVERFPDSWNAYDSYSEALLASGEKSLAMENYKKSFQLNPGSKSGIKHLKELGVDPESVVKLPQIKLEDLKQLEGVYLSTNQPNFIRKITFTVENGELAGEDNGYHYKPIGMGKGKFINPDDGAILLFDTRDNNTISLLLFGKINLKKVEITKHPNLSLKEYSGLYLPSKNDTILKPMEILSSTNKLFRFIENPNDYTSNRNVELQFVTENIFFYPDNSGRSIEFIVTDKMIVTGCYLRRPDGTYILSKKK